MADEIFNPNFRTPGQSVPTPDAPIVSDGFAPIDNSPPDAPILSISEGGAQGSIDPAADRVLQWWMNSDTQAQYGPTVLAQFDPTSGPLNQVNNLSLKTFNAPWYMPSGMLAVSGGRSLLWALVGATLGYTLPPFGKKRGSKIGWGVAGFFFPTLTTGAVALRQVTK